MTTLRAWFGWESLALLAVCLADMLSTLYWVHGGAATEANPLMAYWLARGDAHFVAAKLLSFFPLLAVAAYVRPRRPRLIAVSLRAALALYVLIYVGAQIVQHLPG